ncbi:uncharacterized protein LOC143184753 [Calliopsis andreniformis]|uniref:uncharacterized protein LOC143184753 n=1 Tax=Calliopsis andreniformis TaxID=337506 RepID=UPI003FCDD516
MQSGAAAGCIDKCRAAQMHVCGKTRVSACRPVCLCSIRATCPLTQVEDQRFLLPASSSLTRAPRSLTVCGYGTVIFLGYFWDGTGSLSDELDANCDIRPSLGDLIRDPGTVHLESILISDSSALASVLPRDNRVTAHSHRHNRLWVTRLIISVHVAATMQSDASVGARGMRGTRASHVRATL